MKTAKEVQSLEAKGMLYGKWTADKVINEMRQRAIAINKIREFKLLEGIK